KDDYSSFAPVLTRVIELKKRIAEAIAGDDCSAVAYDTLMDEYEPGMTTEVMQGLVDTVRPDLVALVAEMAPRSAQVDARFISAGYPSDLQLAFGKEVVGAMGFDFERGRLDLTTHPFCSEMGTSSDVRITTRVDEADFTSNLFSIIHEAGHGLYEQGLDPQWAGTPLGSSVSLGIHESQSRLWENNIARSAPFWKHWLPRMRSLFPVQLDGVEEGQFMRAVNRVIPSLIRVEADEVTYSLHVMLRFELEQGIFSGEIGVGDLPGLWREKMGEYLGVVPETDAEGVLQDIHWSMGAFGYFPTYFLGNLYSAQIEVAAREAIPDLDQRLGDGEMLTLREWLEEKVHRPGRRWPAQELCRRVSGDDLDPGVYLGYLRRKYDSLYPGS
ncbi:MAG TPA: carboxypeptidase M32, partial [Planctomycetes bacterium]|nr:carboxypeptidase M32 [Planctomycetota bacterium]